MEDPFGHWLAGFMDGEACFYIRSDHRTGKHQCGMRVALRDDDAAIIERIHAETGIGNVTRSDWHARQRPTNRPQANWTISSRADCVRLVELLRRFPLRSKKARDFEVWARAVEVWTAVGERGEEPGARRGQKGGRSSYNWREMESLAAELQAVRAYAAAA